MPDPQSTPTPSALALDEELRALHGWWRAANYLSVGQIYLRDNPLLRRPLAPEDVKPRLLGHWGTTPGLTFLYAHMNRAIRHRALRTLFVTGPGHGGPGIVASTYLEGTYSEIYPAVSRDEAGLKRLVTQFSFPGGIPSHAAPETPGSIHEGGELGYSLSHAYGAMLDHPGQLAVAVIGDGEAETGPLAGSWQANAFMNPARDGAVLPILHLNGYKIANPTVLARIGEEDLLSLMRGHGHEPHLFTAGFDDEEALSVHRRFAALLDEVLDRIEEITREARDALEQGREPERPRWPMIILRTPKGWTGPEEVDGERTEGTWRSHQVPLTGAREDPAHLEQLERWLRSYRPEELFDEAGRLREEFAGAAPQGDLRMSANPISNGGSVLEPLRLPPVADHALDVPAPGEVIAEPTRVLGAWLRDVIAQNPRTFRLFGPDETASNRLQAVYDVTDKQWGAELLAEDREAHMARSGRVMEVLSEHLCQGWLEGYLLTGRHGLLSSYEAFIHIVDSMVNQHAKWLKVTNELEWRRPLASLTYLLSSHVWRQDHNGFSHQDPGFIDHVVNKKAEVVRVYLPPDTNTLLSTMDHCLRSRQYVNVVVAGKQPGPSWLSMDEAALHCARGLGIWQWAGTEVAGETPDVVLACAGDIPTIETLAAAKILAARVPGLRIRVVNVVDLMRLQEDSEHPHGLSRRDFEGIFGEDVPVVFAYHGYPWLIHRLAYRHDRRGRIHVRGFIEEGTTTTPFDMLMRNDLDRYRLVMDVIDRVGDLATRFAPLRQEMADERMRARAHAYAHGEDAPQITAWQWGDGGDQPSAAGVEDDQA